MKWTDGLLSNPLAGFAPCGHEIEDDDFVIVGHA